MTRQRTGTVRSPHPTPNSLRVLLPAVAGLAVTLAWAAPSQADQLGPYSQRSLTLGRGTLRVDGGPPDFGYFHPSSPQWLNEGRGLRLQSAPGNDVQTWIGVGFAGGITDDIEVGGLLPLQLTSEVDVDDPEVYGRFRFLDGRFEMAFQGTLQLPGETEFGIGLGLPMLAHVSQRFRIDTGFEFEILFWEPDTVVALDIPAAFTWDIGARGFLGLRTGMYVWQMDDVAIPAGIHGGGILGRSGNIDLAGWFIWPSFIATGRDDPFEVEFFELGFGVNGRIP